MTRFLALVLVVAATGLTYAAPPAKRPAPDFTLPATSGDLSLHDLRGKVVYVDFWASWCAPCRESFPWMSGISEKYRDQGLVVVAINLDKNKAAADEFIRQFGGRFPVAFDPAGKSAEAFGVQAMPSSFIVNRFGVITYTHEGFQPRNADEVEAHITEALAR